ncbi:hypothetical protein BGZ65_002903, partial [Modicella reniformis]
MLTHVRLNVREAAAEVLGRQDKLSEVSFQALIRNLSNGDPSVREVVRALGGQVVRLESAVLALIEMLKDEHPGVRGAAIHALE